MTADPADGLFFSLRPGKIIWKEVRSSSAVKSEMHADNRACMH